jgi:hypothetical protein
MIVAVPEHVMTSPREFFENQFKRASAEGALYELRMRLLADKVPQLQLEAYDAKADNVETLIVQHFANALTDDEKDMLRRCRQLRNKILHCDFLAMRNKLKELGKKVGPGNVKRINVTGLTGKEIGEKIEDALTDRLGTFEYVANTKPVAGTVYGWLFELGAAGDFVLAADVFTRARAILDRLATL